MIDAEKSGTQRARDESRAGGTKRGRARVRAVIARKPFVIAGVAAASALMLASLETTQTWAQQRSFGNAFDWLRGFGESFTVWIAVAMLAPIAFSVARRHRVDRNPRKIVVHLAAALLFGVAASIVAGTVLALRHREVAFLFMLGKVIMFN